MKYSLRIDKILEVFANWLLSGWQWNATDAVTNLEFMIFLFSLLFHLEESIRFMIFNLFTNFLNQYISTKEGIRSVILASWGSQVIWKCWYLGINKKTTITKRRKTKQKTQLYKCVARLFGFPGDWILVFCQSYWHITDMHNAPLALVPRQL